jgi:hypothetical protein
MAIAGGPVHRARQSARLQLLVARRLKATLSSFKARQVINLMRGALGADVCHGARDTVGARLQAKIGDPGGEVYACSDIQVRSSFPRRPEPA